MPSNIESRMDNVRTLCRRRVRELIQGVHDIEILRVESLELNSEEREEVRETIEKEVNRLQIAYDNFISRLNELVRDPEQTDSALVEV